MKAVAAFRILAGLLIVLAGAWYLGMAISVIVSRIDAEPFYGLDGTWPLGFAQYGTEPVWAVVLMITGLAVIKRWWQILSLTCGVYLTVIMMEWLSLVFLPHSPGFVTLDLVIALTAIMIVVACEATREPNRSAPPPHKLPVIIFTGLAVVGLVWRTASFFTSPEAASAFDYLKGISDDLAGEIVDVANGAVSPVLAVLLVGALVAWLKGHTRLLHVALAVIAAFSFYGALRALDMTFVAAYQDDGTYDGPWLSYAHRVRSHIFLEALTFVGSIGALAAVMLRRRAFVTA